MRAVHPRARGEHIDRIPIRIPNSGSSPRTRGTLYQHHTLGGSTRFIPAHAGNTRHHVMHNEHSSVHPRARGEHGYRGSRTDCTTGSSPRTRGTRAFWTRSTMTWRFIPAHAGNTCSPASAQNPDAVHPRARGEHHTSTLIQHEGTGSSPRTRGTRHDNSRRSCRIRFIPAHAGNTHPPPVSPVRASVHPRARGEHMSIGLYWQLVGGSSPRTRGTPDSQDQMHSCLRFIPAHAGNTPSRAHTRHPYARFIPAHAGNTTERRDRRRWLTVHPRARGEHVPRCRVHEDRAGSSPRTRGTQGVDARVGGGCRFIPAHAGNTAGMSPRIFRVSVHPRARGEHPLSPCGPEHIFGSSPRTRGTPFPYREPVAETRFIPAHAGNTSRCRHRPQPTAVHPRARGEHCPSSLPGRFSVGSSPRTRGTPLSQPLDDLPLRFIPAHAGNTWEKDYFTSSLPVHPRARGEHGDREKPFQAISGSSPRTRGTRDFSPGNDLSDRFIPAHAGNTDSAKYES